MTFLQNINPLKRLQIQYHAFLATNNLCFLDTLSEVQSFEYNFNQLSEKELVTLKFEKKLRLGNRLEHFLSFALNNSSDFKILAQNIQVVENKITLGELDFIIQERNTNNIFHLELANKFYLYNASISSEIKRWIGPNRNDSLIKKITKLNNKQFPLLKHKQTQLALKELEINLNILKQQLLFKTQLFLPISLYKAKVLAKNIEGFYIAENMFLNKEYETQKYFIPEKQDWQIDAKNGEQWFSYQEIQASIKMYLSEKKSPLVWMKKTDGTFEKFFVVWW